jgi:hypothetical protein
MSQKTPIQETITSNNITLITDSNNKGRTKKPTTEYKVHIQKVKLSLCLTN